MKRYMAVLILVTGALVGCSAEKTTETVEMNTVVAENTTEVSSMETSTVTATENKKLTEFDTIIDACDKVTEFNVYTANYVIKGESRSYLGDTFKNENIGILKSNERDAKVSSEYILKQGDITKRYKFRSSKDKLWCDIDMPESNDETSTRHYVFTSPAENNLIAIAPAKVIEPKYLLSVLKENKSNCKVTKQGNKFQIEFNNPSSAAIGLFGISESNIKVFEDVKVNQMIELDNEGFLKSVNATFSGYMQGRTVTTEMSINVEYSDINSTIADEISEEEKSKYIDKGEFNYEKLIEL